MFALNLLIKEKLFSSFCDTFFYDPAYLYEGHSSRISITAVGGYHLIDCFFSNLYNSAAGGAISSTFNSSPNDHLIENCFFTNCSSNSHGGAIYISASTFSSLILRKTCSFSCYSRLSTTNYGQFIYSYTQTSKKNDLLLVSVQESYYLPGERFSSIYLISGLQKIFSCNFSNILNKYYSCIYSNTPLNHISLYSTFINNKASQGCILYLFTGTFNYHHSNIINNTQTLTTEGIIRNELSTTVISECIFYLNSELRLLNNVAGSEIMLDNIFCDYFTTIGQLPLFYVTNLLTNTFILEHYSSYNCIAQNPISESYAYPPTNIELNFSGNNNFEYFYPYFTSNQSYSNNIKIEIVHSQNFFLQNSLFYSLLSPTSGSCVSFLSTSSRFLIELCSFFNCTSMGTYGGCIYFSSATSSCILNKNCVSFCKISSLSANYGQFCYLSTKNTMKNEIYHLSIFSCSGNILYSESPIALQYGFQKLNYINSSMNIEKITSAVNLIAINTANVTFSNFKDNFAQNGNCFSFNGGFNELSFSNFINNTQGVSTEGMIKNQGNSFLILKDIYFNLNSQLFIFNNIAGSEYLLFNIYKDTFITTAISAKIINLNTFESSFLISKSDNFSCLLEEGNFPINTPKTQNCENYSTSIQKHYPINSFEMGTIENVKLSISNILNYFIYDSVFEYLLSTSTGGAISLVDKYVRLLIENSKFYFCVTVTTTGGGIYFSSSTGSLTINKIISSYCYSSNAALSSGQFLYSFTRQGFINQFILSSIQFCSSNFGLKQSPIYFKSGFQKLSSDNISYNHNNIYSILYSESSSTFEAKYCSFIHNIAESYTEIAFSGGNNSIYHSNIINNTHSTTTDGIIKNLAGSLTSLVYCVFKSNWQYVLFNNLAELNIISCWFDHYSFLGSSNVISNTFSSTSSFILKHINSLSCINEDEINQTLINFSIDYNISDSFQNYFPFDVPKKSFSVDIRLNLESVGGIWLFNSIFISLTSTLSGTAIYLNSIYSKLLIENCFFSQCITTTTMGGAIYFSSTTGSIVLDKVCGTECYSSSTSASYGQFSYLLTKFNYINELHFTSISNCSPNTITSQSPLFIKSGLQKLKSLNISKNIIQTYSSITLDSSTNSLIVFCTISSNYAKGSSCIYFNSGLHNISSSNLINNTQYSISEGIYKNYLSTTIFYNSIFHQNSQKNLFNNVVGSELFILICYMDYYSLVGTSPVISHLYEPTSTFSLNHFGTVFCYAENTISSDPISFSIDNTNYNEYFPGQIPKYGQIRNSRFQLSDQKSQIIHNSIFIEISSTSSGGAIYIYNLGVFVLIENCFFSQCITTTTMGGAIYFSSTTGSIVLDKVCGTECYSSSTSASYGQFSYLLTKFNYINELHFTSISNCSPNTITSQSPLFIKSGLQKLKSLNISKNIIQTYSVIIYDFPHSSLTQFCSFIDNYAKNTNSIRYMSSYNILKWSNLINNTQSLLTEGIIKNEAGANTKIMFCIFNNNGPFKLINNLANLEILSCWSNYFSFTGLSVTTVNNKGLTNTHIINHLNTQLCKIQTIPDSTYIQDMELIDNSLSINLDGDVYRDSIIRNIRFQCDIHDSYFIHDSLFIYLYSDTYYGGAICFNNFQGKMFILSTLFFYCNTSQPYGGAIYYYSPDKGSLFIEKTCAVSCYSNYLPGSVGQFIYSYTSLNGSNSIKFSTITLCSSPLIDANKQSTIYLSYGNQLIDSINISNNFQSYYSVLHHSLPTTLETKYSSFLNNFNSYHTFLYIYGGIDNFYHSNFLNNSQDQSYFTSQHIHIESGSIATFGYCIFNSYYQILNIYNNGILSLIDCSFHQIYSLTGLSLSMLYTPIISKNPLILNHYSSFLCYTEILTTQIIIESEQNQFISDIFLLSRIFSILFIL